MALLHWRAIFRIDFILACQVFPLGHLWMKLRVIFCEWYCYIMHRFFESLRFTAERNRHRRHRLYTLLTSICLWFIISCPSEVIIINGYGVPAAIITSAVLHPDHSIIASLPAYAALQAAWKLCWQVYNWEAFVSCHMGFQSPHGDVCMFTVHRRICAVSLTIETSSWEDICDC